MASGRLPDNSAPDKSGSGATGSLAMVGRSPGSVPLCTARLAALGSGQDEPFHRVGEALVLIRGSNTTGGSLDLMARVTHGDAESRAGEHEHVVGLVADRGDLFRRDLVGLREVPDHDALVGLGMGDIGVVRL